MILITGDSGFIGRFLASSLLKRGYKVMGIDLVPKNSSTPNYPQSVGDIRDRGLATHAAVGVDSIIHLAAEHKDFGIPAKQYYSVNVEGTKMLLAIAREMDVKNFIFFSSVAVYGNQHIPSEDSAPYPVTSYGQSKLEAEQLVREWVQEDPLRSCLIIRPSVIFGPLSRGNIFRLIRSVCDGMFLWIGSGTNIKSIGYVENLVEATLFLIERIRPGIQIYNYSDEPQFTTKQLITLIANKAGVSVPRFKIPVSVGIAIGWALGVFGRITHRELPVTAARIRKFLNTTCYPAEKIRRLGFKQPFALDEGIERTVRWYLHDPERRMGFQYESSDI